MRSPGEEGSRGLDFAVDRAELRAGVLVDDLVRAALESHPSLRAMQARVLALEQAAIQARHLPDPTVSAGGGEMAETAAGQVQGSFRVQQNIPYPGKRSARERITERRAQVLRAGLVLREVKLAEEVRLAYWDYYAGVRAASLIRESRDLLETLQASLRMRVVTNQARQDELLELNEDITKLEQRLLEVEGRVEAAQSTLNALLSRPVGDRLPAPQSSPMRKPAFYRQREQTRGEHPEILAAEANIAAAETAVQLAQLGGRPDFAVGAAYSPVSDGGLAPSANGQDQFMATLGLTLPLWGDKNRASVEEARAQLAARKADLSSIRLRLQQKVERSQAHYEAEQKNFSLYPKLIADAQQNFELATTAYQTESRTFGAVMVSWRQLLSRQLEQAETRARLGKAEARLRAALGHI